MSYVQPGTSPTAGGPPQLPQRPPGAPGKKGPPGPGSLKPGVSAPNTGHGVKKMPPKIPPKQPGEGPAPGNGNPLTPGIKKAPGLPKRPPLPTPKPQADQPADQASTEEPAADAPAVTVTPANGSQSVPHRDHIGISGRSQTTSVIPSKSVTPADKKSPSFRDTVHIPASAAILGDKALVTSETHTGESVSDPNRSLDTALADTLFQKVEVKINSKRDNIALEMLTTEQSYLKSLTVVNELMRKPLLEVAKTGNFPMSEETVTNIFTGDFTGIMRVNFTLLAGLVERLGSWSDTQVLGDVLLALTPFLQMYKNYTANYERAIQILDEYEPKEAVATFMTKCYENPIRAGLNLRAYLIMPIQRIPRYRLLIEDLVKNTPPEHPDAENLAKALSKVKVVAEQVDAAISEAKNRESMLKIQKRLFDMNVFEAGRYFIREGIVHKICRKSHQEKNLFLFNDAILYATEMPGGRLVKPTMLMLHTTAVKDLPDDPKRNQANAIQIASDKKSFVWYTNEAAEKAAWLKDINKALDVLDEASKTLKNDSKQRRMSAVAPVWVPDNESKTCTICGAKFTFTNRRHHCRQCGALVCGKCSTKRKDLPGQGRQRVCDICFDKPYESSARAKGELAHQVPLAQNSDSDEEDTNSGASDTLDNGSSPSLVVPNSGAPPGNLSAASPVTSSLKDRLAAQTPERQQAAGSPALPTRPTTPHEALYDYVAPETDTPKKLSFSAGDILNVIQKDNSGWWLAELNGNKGWVPAGYLN